MDFTFFKELQNAIAGEIKLGARMKSVNKENFKENLSILDRRFTTFVESIEMLSMDDRRKLAKRIFTYANKPENVACNAYCEIAKQVSGKDLQYAFATYTFVANKFIGTFANISRALDKLFIAKSLSVYNAQLLHVAVFGIIGDAEKFINFSTYMFDNIMYETTQHQGIRELPPPQKYRISFVNKYKTEFVSICQARLSNTDESIEKQMLSDPRPSDLNTTLVGENNESNLGFINVGKLAPAIRNMITTGARKFVIFRWLGEQWNILKHSRYLKSVKEKEWLETHVALLQMDLNNVDPNSDEYRTKVKIIESYNVMIADLDKKINTYIGD